MHNLSIEWKYRRQFIHFDYFLSNTTIRYKFVTSHQDFTSTTDIHFTLYVGYVKDDKDVWQYMFLSSCIKKTEVIVLRKVTSREANTNIITI